MQTIRLGVIGCGNMGSAIVRGILDTESLRKQFPLFLYDISKAQAQKIASSEALTCDSPQDLTQTADIILLAVKPYQIMPIMETITPHLNAGKVLISIAAGITLSAMRKALNGTCPAVQVMPNTPAMVGQGVFGLCFDDPNLPQEKKELLLTLFSGLGKTFVIEEKRMTAFSAVAGCGPAYVFQMMDAVVEAAVTLGFTRQEAAEMTFALFKGSATLAAESHQHPQVLHSGVTSPGGMTIIGTNHMARTAMRGHLIDSVLAAYARGKEMESE